MLGLACDGARVLVMRNEGNAELLNLVLVDSTTRPEPPTRMLGSDREGPVTREARKPLGRTMGKKSSFDPKSKETVGT